MISPKQTVSTKPAVSSVANYVTGALMVAPGSIFVIQGQNLATQSVEFARPFEKVSQSLPLALGGAIVTVFFGAENRSVPLYSVAPYKIVAQCRSRRREWWTSRSRRTVSRAITCGWTSAVPSGFSNSRAEPSLFT